jgi:predicted transcriptional regulator
MSMKGEFCMLRERLKNMDLRITELADYLQISRPTMYKFIECYENSEFDSINSKVLKLFNFIKENELAGKKTIIKYILEKLVDVKELEDKNEADVIKKIRKFIISNPESKKSKFFEVCANKTVFDDIIYYLMDIENLVKKRKLTDEENALLLPYLDFKEKIKNIKKGE